MAYVESSTCIVRPDNTVVFNAAIILTSTVAYVADVGHIVIVGYLVFHRVSLFLAGAKYRHPNPRISTHKTKVHCTKHGVRNYLKKIPVTKCALKRHRHSFFQLLSLVHQVNTIAHINFFVMGPAGMTVMKSSTHCHTVIE